MIDAIVIGLVLAALVFTAGLYSGSKRPVHRAQRKLRDLQNEQALAQARIRSISPLHARAAELIRVQQRLDYLAGRRNELDAALVSIDNDLSDLCFRKENDSLTFAKRANLEHAIAHLACEKIRLRENLSTVLGELTPLQAQFTADTAVFEIDRAKAQIADGAGFGQLITS